MRHQEGYKQYSTHSHQVRTYIYSSMAKKQTKSRRSNYTHGNHPKSRKNLERGITFADDPGRINKAGRPKLLTHRIIEIWKKAGYEKLSPSQAVELMEYVGNLDEAELKRFAADKSVPYMHRKLISGLGTSEWLQVYQLIMDRAYGRAKQTINASIVEPLLPENRKPDHDVLLKDLEAKMNAIDKKNEKNS